MSQAVLFKTDHYKLGSAVSPHQEQTIEKCTWYLLQAAPVLGALDSRIKAFVDISQAG